MTDLAAIKQHVADLARPSVLYATGWSVAFSTGWLAVKGTDLLAAAGFIAAGFAGVGALYGAKAIEETRKSGHTAEIEKKRAEATPPPAAALQTADAPSTADEPDPAMFGGPRG